MNISTFLFLNLNRVSTLPPILGEIDHQCLPRQPIVAIRPYIISVLVIRTPACVADIIKPFVAGLPLSCYCSYLVHCRGLWRALTQLHNARLNVRGFGPFLVELSTLAWPLTESGEHFPGSCKLWLTARNVPFPAVRQQAS